MHGKKDKICSFDLAEQMKTGIDCQSERVSLSVVEGYFHRVINSGVEA